MDSKRSCMRTTLKSVLVAVWGLSLVAASTALAQDTVGTNLEGGLNLSSKDPGGVGGFKVGEGVFLRAGVAGEAGYDTNVFYNDQFREEAAILLVTPSLELTNAGRDESRPPLHFSLGAQLA